MSAPDDDQLEGCGIGFDVDPTPDDMIPWVALFATVDERHHGFLHRVGHHHEAHELADQWRELFGGES